MDNVKRSKSASFVRKMCYKSGRFVSKIAKSQFGESFGQKIDFRFRGQKWGVTRCLKLNCFEDMTPVLSLSPVEQHGWHDRNNGNEKRRPAQGLPGIHIRQRRLQKHPKSEKSVVL